MKPCAPPRWGSWDKVEVGFDKRHCVCVVVASEGYPGSYPKGKVITGIEDAEKDGAVVFHAGTKAQKGEVVTSGGRVLNVCALGDSLKEAQAKANAAAEKIQFDGAWFRKDIGFRVM